MLVDLYNSAACHEIEPSCDSWHTNHHKKVKKNHHDNCQLFIFAINNIIT